jgi:peptidyl-prolyl cis-trans isomerase D
MRPVATVDCRPLLFGLGTLPGTGCHQIFPDEVDRETVSMRRLMENRFGADAQARLQGVNLREMAVQKLIQEELFRRESSRIGLEISDATLERTLETQTAFQQDGHFDVALYNQILRQNDLEPAVFEAGMRTEIMSNTLRSMITDPVQVSTDEARRQFDRFAEKLSLAYIEFPYTDFTANAHPSDPEVAKFYNQNRQAFAEPDRAKVVFIRYDPSAMKADFTPSDADIQSFYEKNADQLFTHKDQVRAHHILIAVPADASAAQQAAAKAKADELLQKLKSGADFAKLAAQYSDDPGSKNSGGDLGYFERGQMIKPFDQAAFSMRAGQLALVRSQYGYHVLRVDDVKSAHVDTPDEARPQIIAALARKASVDLARQLANQDLSAALEGRSLQQLAKKRGLDAVETPFFAQDEPVKGVEDDPKFAATVFTMKERDIQIVDDGAAPYLVMLVERSPAHVPPFDQIKDLVRMTLIRDNARKAAHQGAVAMLKQIATPPDFDRVAAAKHLQVHDTGDFMRATRSIPAIGAFPEVVEAAAMTSVIPGLIPQVMDKDGNSYIFKVLGRTAPSEEDWKSRGPAFTEELLSHRREVAWENFVNQLRQRAYVTIDYDQIGQTAGS